MSAASTRRQIVAAADRLFYEHGFEATSFADIALAVRISRGNFYYHFRTKDEILDAVISLRLAKTRAMLDAWEAESAAPADRVRSFIHILVVNRASIMRHGCPVGTLCSELAKLDHAARGDASRLFTLFRDWLARQFAGWAPEADADALAMHVLARSQGIAALANAFHDDAFIRREVDGLCAWLEGLHPGGTRASESPSPRPT